MTPQKVIYSLMNILVLEICQFIRGDLLQDLI